MVRPAGLTTTSTGRPSESMPLTRHRTKPEGSVSISCYAPASDDPLSLKLQDIAFDGALFCVRYFPTDTGALNDQSFKVERSLVFSGQRRRHP
jgi:hypothetical protein